MKRKTIAVCVTGFDLEYEMDVVRGIKDKCRELGINLLAFYNPTRKPPIDMGIVIPDDLMNGEMSVYKLIDYDNIDGIVIFGESILGEAAFFEICEKAKAHNVPLINVDDLQHTAGKRIVLSNSFAMSSVVEHLITVHGLTRIDFIGGFKEDNIQSEERLAAYKATLEKHGIPVEEDRIFYGEFWQKAIGCTEEILSRDELPEAIVCANDTMAFFCMDTIKAHGLKIPDDIIVTGFDAIKDCRDYSPTPTTVRRATYESGSVAVELLLKMAAGEEIDDVTYVESVLMTGQSCGCKPLVRPDEISYNQRYFYYQDFKEFTRFLLFMDLAHSSVTESVHLFDSLYDTAKFFKLKELYVCISDDLENSAEKIDLDSEESPWKLPEHMVSLFQMGHGVPVGYRFPTKLLLPYGIDDSEAPVCYAFAPLYFKKFFLGYMAGVLTDMELDDSLLATWLTTVSNNVGSFYMNNKLERALDELEALNLHDALTGLYNRRGMKKYEHELLNRAIAEGRYFSVICADVDGLKVINDAYGHEEGDKAISVCSRTLLEVFPEDSICVRTGGDEFMVLGVFDDEKAPDNYIKEIYGRVAAYNAEHDEQYKVGCSCGYVIVKPTAETSLSELKNEADSRMYTEKHRRKTVRKF
ncbi:GGDEF domain-containing protein [Ruminococcus sp.]|uniref:GGDEF domain-containing protein n=1 Tax=Ruminococcus sp. TaxID=41978 RepID=UPI0025E95758|nr:GGDEF domain-containing protein [Ruminococcus sp.]MBQ8966917.1 GGDEF domain-containing protein [Ruminococcus sp.]